MLHKLSAKVATSAFLSLAFLILPATIAFSAELSRNVSRRIQQAIDQGPVDPTEEINITVHLKATNKVGLDERVKALYDPASPSYEHWLTDAQLQAYAPSPKAVAAVRAELEKHGLTILSVDPLGFSVRAHGMIGNVETAFQTQIHQYTLDNRTFRSHVQSAVLTSGASAYVHAVSGLDGSQAHPLAKPAINPRTGKALPPRPLKTVLASPNGLSGLITDKCFTAPKTFTLTGSTPLPVGVYFGNDYDDTTQVCSFTSSQLQTHYGLESAYKLGIDGTGQTVVLLEAYGYPTIEADANAFSQLNGLPQLGPSNFEIIYPEGLPKNPNAGPELGWDVEIAIDVQWAHSIAPKAKIIVVIDASQDNEDLQDAITYAVNHHLGNSISNSWGTDSDQFAGIDEVESFNTVFEYAAARGVSVNFASGDNGDDGNGGPIGAPEVPADAPYATAVGGTSILNYLNGSSVEVGWGNVQTGIGFDGPYDPPFQFGFTGGAGGGESIFFDKPKWQSALPGTGRQVPDVSALSDPYTGVFIIVTQQGVQYIEPGWGGTSLGCPIFSAFWVLANEAAGHSLGQAAPRLAKLTGKELIDIVPVTSATNAAGTVFDSSGPTYYSPLSLVSAGVYPPTVDFVSAIWPYQGSYAIEGFGLDSTLSVAIGWDNVTGFGVPNGLTFIQGVGK